jgi:integrase
MERGTVPRKGEYLFKRKGSQNWWARFRYTGELAKSLGTRMREHSLGTPDRREAELKVLPLIQQHKRLLLLHSAGGLHNILEERFSPDPLPPGEHVLPSGDRVLSTGDKLIYLDKHSPHYLREIPNRPVRSLRTKTEEPVGAAIARTYPKAKPVPDSDRAFLNNWIGMGLKKKPIPPRVAKDAEGVFELFKTLTNGKRFTDCDRDDGRLLANYLFDQGLKSATVAKKVGFLSSTVRKAIKDGKLRFNPFEGVVVDKADRINKAPLDNEDMTVMRVHLDQLDGEHRLLWTLLATTGMRLSEAFEISREEPAERGVRFVMVGAKSEASERRVPLPSPVLRLVSPKITVRLFSGTAKNMGRNLNRAMRRAGITQLDESGGEQKTVHCLRHRAKDRLRAAGCPLDIQYHLLGHEEKTVAAGYGKGYPVPKLKQWIEKIGY